MPAQRKQSEMMRKYGPALSAAVQQHADSDEVLAVNRSLPAGINNGVAQVVTAKFDKYKTGKNQGEWYLRMEAVVFEPTEVTENGRPVKVAGLHTSIMLPVCATTGKRDGVDVTNTVADNVNKILVRFRSLGLNTKGKTDADLEDLAEQVVALKPFVAFRTSPKKDQQTGQVTGSWENWDGAIDDYVPPADDAGDVDDTEAVSPPPPPAPAAKPGPKATAGKAPPKSPPPPPPPAAEYSDSEDLDSLLERANGEGKDAEAAQDRLGELGEAAGMTKDEVTNAPSWEFVVAKLKGEDPDGPADGGNDDGEAAADEEPEFLPKVLEVYSYRAMTGPAGKQVRAKKATDHEIVTVDEAGKTVTLKSLDTNEVLKDPKTKKPLKVPFGDLEGE